MANYFQDNEDLQFYVDHLIDWPTLVDAVERHYTAVDAPKNWEEAVSTYREVFELIGEFVANEVAPRAKEIDETGNQLVDGKVIHPRPFVEIFDQLKEMGVHGLTVPRELGGMNAPALLYFIICELFSRADASVMTHYGFHAGIATSMLQYSLREGSTEFDENGRIIKTRWQEAIEEILRGEAWGAMDLTEPQAGSDLAAIRTRAVKQDDGTWLLTGNKIFITSGHGKYHFVIAKTKDEDDLKAISLFMVPMTIEKDGETVQNFYVDRIEEKIGHHGSATCSLQFEDSVGELVGKEGEGFHLMLMLMNNARIGVGFESIGTCESAYRLAKDYAEERWSMGKPIARHEMIADYLEEMDLTIKALRAMAMEAGFHEEMSTRLEYLQRIKTQAGDVHETHKEVRHHKRIARKLTPLLKYGAAESAVWMSRMSMQVMGGNGYMHDYGAEKLLRDALVMPVYEGTSQIQSLMALKDTLGNALKKPQRFLRKLAAAKLGAIRSTDELERRYYGLSSLSYSAQQHILLKIAKDKWSVAMEGPLPQFIDRFTKDWDPKRDFSFGLLHAEHLTRILFDVAVARILMEQAKRFPERRELALAWIDRAEPRVRYQWDLIVHTGDRVLGQLADREAREPLPETKPAAEKPAEKPSAKKKTQAA